MLIEIKQLEFRAVIAKAAHKRNITIKIFKSVDKKFLYLQHQ
jgi:hypothetical protein